MLSETAAHWFSLTVLVVGLAALLVCFVIHYHRQPYGWRIVWMYPIYVVYSRIIWGTRAYGRIDMPPGQGAVIVANHRCQIDPTFTQVAVEGQLVSWFVAKEFCEMPVIGPLLLSLGVIPTSRGGIDTAATKIAIRYAQEGRYVGLFPEGRINDTNRLLLPGRPGAALIALKARVPVIPCFIRGAPYDKRLLGPFFRTARVRTFIGHPIDMTPYCDRYERGEDRKAVQAEVTLRFLKEMARLGGRPDYEPELAGRRWRDPIDENDRELAEEGT